MKPESSRPGRTPPSPDPGKAEIPFPDARSASFILRSVLLVNAGVLLVALSQTDVRQGLSELLIQYSWKVEPILIASMGCVAFLSPMLQKLAGNVSRALAIVVVMLLAGGMSGALQALAQEEPSGAGLPVRFAAIAGVAAWLVFYESSMRYRLVRPAVDSAQLAALTARIRPHFLFNSLNAVLSLIRTDPHRAEAALENLADLFRVVMKDSRNLVSLSEEIALCRQYLDLEKLRLGERLQVVWEIDEIPAETMVPPLMLQPLLENAVYHGIEPSADGGKLSILLQRDGRRTRIVIANTLPDRMDRISPHSPGNQMAMENIRQRLLLHYDLDAELQTAQSDNLYSVTLILPVRSG